MKKSIVFILLSVLIIASCARMRDNRAARHQPYKPHLDKKPSQKRH